MKNTSHNPFQHDQFKHFKWEGPMKLYYDNKSATSIAHNPTQYDRTKHIEVVRHFIKEKLDSGLILSVCPHKRNLWIFSQKDRIA